MYTNEYKFLRFAIHIYKFCEFKLTLLIIVEWIYVFLDVSSELKYFLFNLDFGTISKRKSKLCREFRTIIFAFYIVTCAGNLFYAIRQFTLILRIMRNVNVLSYKQNDRWRFTFNFYKIIFSKKEIFSLPF